MMPQQLSAERVDAIRTSRTFTGLAVGPGRPPFGTGGRG